VQWHVLISSGCGSLIRAGERRRPSRQMLGPEMLGPAMLGPANARPFRSSASANPKAQQ